MADRPAQRGGASDSSLLHSIGGGCLVDRQARQMRRSDRSWRAWRRLPDTFSVLQFRSGGASSIREQRLSNCLAAAPLRTIANSNGHADCAKGRDAGGGFLERQRQQREAEYEAERVAWVADGTEQGKQQQHDTERLG